MVVRVDEGVNIGDGIPSGVKMGVGYEGHVMFF